MRELLANFIRMQARAIRLRLATGMCRWLLQRVWSTTAVEGACSIVTKTHYTQAREGRKQRSWGLKRHRTTKSLLKSDVATSQATANSCLPPKRPVHLGFEPLNFLGRRTIKPLDYRCIVIPRDAIRSDASIHYARLLHNTFCMCCQQYQRSVFRGLAQRKTYSDVSHGWKSGRIGLTPSTESGKRKHKCKIRL